MTEDDLILATQTWFAKRRAAAVATQAAAAGDVALANAQRFRDIDLPQIQKDQKAAADASVVAKQEAKSQLYIAAQQANIEMWEAKTAMDQIAAALQQTGAVEQVQPPILPRGTL